MNTRFKRPFFVPTEFVDELAKLSKSALMDLVWDYAVSTTASTTTSAIMDDIRDRRDVVLIYRTAM